MNDILIKNACLVNEGKIIPHTDVLIANGIIKEIGQDLSDVNAHVIDATGLYLIPGLIDDQVHFREPGLTHKAEIYTEAKAAVAGGITSYMEMPNTVPSATTIEKLEEKYKRAAEVSLANYSFFMGTTNDNLEELLKVNPEKVCGIKIFMGSSTGDMLVDNPESLEKIFKHVKHLIATHCEDDPMIKANAKIYNEKHGHALSAIHHPLIRSREACYKSSAYAVSLAKKYGTRLHILHISTREELDLFDNSIPLIDKKITSEACTHHLWFCDDDYVTKGNLIKWNPAVKTSADRDAILQAVIDNRIDVLATDHAPHTLEEKQQAYAKAPSGGPLVQHALLALLDLYHQHKITLEKIIEKACHNPAILFRIKNRGFIRKGYFADLVLVNLNKSQTVSKENILYKCRWSPFEGHTFKSSVTHTFVNGNLVYENGKFFEAVKGMRLEFNPNIVISHA
jgi:dihydroorotase